MGALTERAGGRNITPVEQEFQVLPRHGTAAVDRGAELLVARARERAAGRADRARVGDRDPQEHRVAAGQRARAPRPDRAGRPARPPAPRPGDPARRRAQHARAQHRRARPARRSTRSREASGETINLAVPARDGVEHVAQVDSRPLPRHRPVARPHASTITARRSARCSWRSARAPLPAGAAAGARPGHDHRPGAAASRARAASAARGYATAVDELEAGLAAMAAPVRGARGDVIAALSITGPTLRHDAGADRRAATDPDRARRATLSRRLGHREEGEHAA